MADNKTVEMIKRHEGFRSKAYKCTAGKLTIGYGRNLDDNGITEQEAEVLLENDISAAAADAAALFENFAKLNSVRQGVLIDMAFNLGKARLAGFRKFREAVGRSDFIEAKKQMLDSAWAGQVPSRANELAVLMEKGEWS